MTRPQQPESRPAPTQTKRAGSNSTHQLYATTLIPEFAYVHVEIITDPPPAPSPSAEDGADKPAEQQDWLQVLFLCRAALQRFLGATGTAIPLDVLKVKGAHSWLRLPRPDLAAFAAALAAYPGSAEDGALRVLRMHEASDWLGAMVGSDGQTDLWGS